MNTPSRTRKRAPRPAHMTVISGRLAKPWEWGSERTGMVEIIRRVRSTVLKGMKGQGRGPSVVRARWRGLKLGARGAYVEFAHQEKQRKEVLDGCVTVSSDLTRMASKVSKGGTLNAPWILAGQRPGQGIVLVLSRPGKSFMSGPVSCICRPHECVRIDFCPCSESEEHRDDTDSFPLLSEKRRLLQPIQHAACPAHLATLHIFPSGIL